MQKENIKKLFEFHDAKISQLHAIEKRQIQIAGDVEHIKGRIDNGMGHSIDCINKMLMKLEPTIGHHADIIKRIEGIGWTISTALILALLAFLCWGIANGFQLKL